MKHSFIVTTYNIDGYIGACLDSLRHCTRPGDEIIVVDDGSTDGTDARVERMLTAGGFGKNVSCRQILLGANTMGGVGIPANIGMDAARGDAIFFIDGDDWLVPEGFRACRNRFEAAAPDILIANYMEFDETTGTSRAPADGGRWHGLPGEDAGIAALRQAARSMIAVPWRKFYRRDFLKTHGIRFPEGDMFFEDNPFHWQVCQAAGGILFENRVLCQHRVNRPGQTMTSTGLELMAFFHHYETIRNRLPADDTALQGDALSWLLNNMSWHLARLSPVAFWPYASRAAAVLAGCADAVWDRAIGTFAAGAVGGIATALRHGDVAGVVAVWEQAQMRRDLRATERRLLDRIAQSEAKQAQQGLRIDSLRHIAEFRALQALSEIRGAGTTEEQSR